MANLESAPRNARGEIAVRGPEVELRASAILTLVYAISGNSIDTLGGANEAEFTIDFTKGDSTGMQLLFEESEDAAAWRTITQLDGGLNEIRPLDPKITATGTYAFMVPVRMRYIRTQQKALTAATNTLCRVRARGVWAV